MTHGIDTSVPSWRARRATFRDPDRWDFASFLDPVCDLWGDRTAFVLDEPIDYPGFAGATLSYRDVLALVVRFAGALRELGVRRGDRVGLFTANRIEMGFCTYAVARLGAIPVPMNFMLRPNEVEHIVQKAGVDVLVVDPAVWRTTIRDTTSIPSVKRWAILGNDDPPPGVTSMREVMAHAPSTVEPVRPSSQDEVAMLFFTSGTTGFPKGAMLSHVAATIQLRTTARLVSLTPRVPRRRSLLVMPLAHAAGYAQLLLNLGMGITTFLVSRFEPDRIFEHLERARPTLFSGSPAMYRILLANGAAEHDWSSIRVFGGGADAFDDDLVRSVRALGVRRGPAGLRMKPWFIRGYGMAEANSHVAQSPPFPAGDNCCGWVLRPVRHRIVDEDLRDVPKGTPGELVLKGPNITTGYWNDAEATEAAFTPDGWFRTGDLMRAGRFGLLYFVGRSGDIIKSGGYKISANEIDQTLQQHPAVEHAATVGLPHAMKGEQPVSAVRLRDGAGAAPDEILAWARDRLAPYKCPRAIVVMNDMPFTFSLKPKRREVRERLLASPPSLAGTAEED